MKIIKEDIKPTLSKPISDQSKGYEKQFMKSMATHAPSVNLNEVDVMLSEVEQSLKKKIFSLAKMESLVFADPKLTAIYNEMAENGEEKYGYHYNETIQNMIFNDYVLNSPKYLQKYKMAVPKKKKRRDKSGINQAKKAGQETIKKMNPTFKPKQPDLTEGGEPATKVQFLVNETDPENQDVFAYFPEETHNGIYKTGYAHVGQHTSVHPDYAAESREATPEEYAELKAELEGQGYNLEVLNDVQETTGAGSAGAFAPAMGYEKKVQETTTSASSGAYVGPAAWGAGELTKGGKSKAMRKPIWQGGTIIQESNYLTDPKGFEKYIQMLNEQSDADFISKNSQAYGTVNNMNPVNQKIIKNDIQTRKWDEPNLRGNIAEQQANMITTKDQLRQMKAAGQKLMKVMFPSLAGEALYAVAIQLANRKLPLSWDDLPDTNSMWDYLNENGGMSYEEVIKSVKEAVNDRLSEDGYSLDDLMGESNEIKEENQLSNLYQNLDPKQAVQKASVDHRYAMKSNNQGQADKIAGNLKSHLDSKNYNWKQDSYAMEMLGDYLQEETQTMIQPNGTSMSNKAQAIGDQGGSVPMGMQSSGGMNETISKERRNDMMKKIQDVSFQGNSGIPSMAYLSKLSDEELTKQYDMAQKNDPEVRNKISNVLGLNRYQNEVNESLNLLEELNNELDAYSIHHDKLKKMAEERKPSALVLRDRVGSENETNFKKDLQHSGTKEIIDVEKELMYKDQQTDIGNDPQKLGLDIEKQALKTTDAKSGEALKNVGDSANDKGDEIPKRNLTTAEQDEIDLYRKGMHSWVYDNEPSKRFEDRMKADMGEKIMGMRDKQLADIGKQPMYNKDSQPVNDKKIEESMITGRYHDILNKRRLIDFTLDEVRGVTADKLNESYSTLDFTGLGNSYVSKSIDNKVIVNEGMSKILDAYKFYTDGKKVVAVKNPVQKLNENTQKAGKPVVNEQVDKMKHLLGYKPETFTNTNNVKKNRGF